MARTRTSKRKWEKLLLWSSIAVGILLVADGLYYLIPAERSTSRSLIAVNRIILAAYGLVLIWSIVRVLQGLMRRDFTSLVPFTINVAAIVVYMLTSVVEQMHD
jgi:hypothetical protein